MVSYHFHSCDMQNQYILLVNVTKPLLIITLPNIIYCIMLAFVGNHYQCHLKFVITSVLGKLVFLMCMFLLMIVHFLVPWQASCYLGFLFDELSFWLSSVC